VAGKHVQRFNSRTHIDDNPKLASAVEAAAVFYGAYEVPS
jgi:hypothetical protein